MNEMQNEFTEALSQFVIQLEDSGKSETAKYFRSLLDQATDDFSSMEMLDRIISSGSISQYANLSPEEDELFDKLYEKAVILKYAIMDR